MKRLALRLYVQRIAFLTLRANMEVQIRCNDGDQALDFTGNEAIWGGCYIFPGARSCVYRQPHV